MARPVCGRTSGGGVSPAGTHVAGRECSPASRAWPRVSGKRPPRAEPHPTRARAALCCGRTWHSHHQHDGRARHLIVSVVKRAVSAQLKPLPPKARLHRQGAPPAPRAFPRASRPVPTAGSPHAKAEDGGRVPPRRSGAVSRATSTRLRSTPVGTYHPRRVACAHGTTARRLSQRGV
jgi:hypothetical protein